MFYLPHCQGAMRYEEELRRQNPAYAALDVERIDEGEEPARAGQYDYYLVPTYYVAGVKVHEGRNGRSDIKRVFDTALKE